MNKLNAKTKNLIIVAVVGLIIVILGAAAYLFLTPQGNVMRLEYRANSFEGLSESDAKEKASREGLVYREVYIDGQKQGLNANLNFNRINVAVSDGKVVEAHFDEGERFSQQK